MENNMKNSINDFVKTMDRLGYDCIKSNVHCDDIHCDDIFSYEFHRKIYKSKFMFKLGDMNSSPNGYFNILCKSIGDSCWTSYTSINIEDVCSDNVIRDAINNLILDCFNAHMTEFGYIENIDQFCGNSLIVF